ncbi:MAG: regulator of sigma protease [Spartobacteria bacterium]|nr:regulator of sigma protease [Spartobacteria bacterium]
MIFHIGRVILIILEVLILFNLLIVVHELGHFLAARWRGLYIEKFGVWFGKPLWKKTINGVQYSLGSLPFGGFVALPQLAPMDIIEGKADLDRSKLPPVSAFDKIIVAIAGPLFSLILAFVFACLVWTFGYPVSESDMTTVVGYVEKDSPAGKAGIRPGDKILEVDGKPVQRFSGMNDSVTWNVVRSEGETIPFVVERAGQKLNFNVAPYKAEKRGWRRKSIRQVLIYPAVTPVVQKVLPDSPAAAAGLLAGDIIRGFNGASIYNPLALTDYIESHPDETITLQIARGDKLIETKVTPRLLPKQSKPLIGVQWDVTGRLALAHPSPLEQVYNSVTSTVNTITAIMSPKSDVKLQHLSGPVGIVRIYYLLFENEHGWQLALWFSVILNVNLAIINMLPIPVLDGGHIVLGIIESVRRKPLNTRVLEIVQGTCTAVIIAVILYTTFFDVQDLPFVKRKLDRLESQSHAKDPDAP